jgi:hypothetical protein
MTAFDRSAALINKVISAAAWCDFMACTIRCGLWNVKVEERLAAALGYCSGEQAQSAQQLESLPEEGNQVPFQEMKIGARSGWRKVPELCDRNVV